MGHRRQIPSRLVLPLVAAALPVVLLYSSIRTMRELDEQRAVYLRHRVSILVSRLENLDSGIEPGVLRDRLAEEEPYLADLAVIDRSDPGAAELAPLWTGQELFRTEFRPSAFRALVPFHTVDGLRIARIEIDPAAADFLLVHARHNVIVASIGGLVLVALSMYSYFAMRRAARLQLQQLELEHLARIGKMSAVLAHEIRNPLGTIKGFVQLALEKSDDPARRLLNSAVAQTQRLEGLVNDLLAYGRPSPPEWREVQWLEVSGKAEAHARQLVGQRSIQVSISGEPFVWQRDPELLEQSLLNLIRNAVEAIPPGVPGEIHLEAERDENESIAIRVRDSGPGFPEKIRQRLFEPFVTTKASGTGLGLAITRKLAESLGGSLEIGAAPEGGVEAVLRFPKAKRRERNG